MREHRGISVLVCPVDTPGIEVRTFPTLGGGFLCETFLDGVEIPAANLVGAVNGGWDVLMYTLDFERVTAEKIGGFAWVLDAVEERLRETDRLDRAAAGQLARLRGELHAARLLSFRAADMLDRGLPGSATSAMAKLVGRTARAAGRRRLDRPARPRGPRRRLAGGGDPGPCRGALPRLGRLDDRRRHGRGAAARDRAARTGTAPMSLPLEGVRVVEVAQYVAGPLAGSLLAELGAEVIKVEPPGGDAYRQVMPVAPGIGRYFVPLNRGKRSVVLDLKSDAGRARLARLVATADVVVHNAPPARAAAFGLAWEALHARHPALVVGIVTSFGPHGPLAGAPAYDLVAQGRSGLLTSHASRGDSVPVRAGGIPMADLTAGHLLATGVLAALVRARTAGEGQLVEVSLLGAALAVQIQDLVWLGDEAVGEAAAASRADLTARADEIAGGLGDEPVLPLLRGGRRLPGGRLPQPGPAAGVPRRSSASTTRRSRRPTSCRTMPPCSRRSSA